MFTDCRIRRTVDTVMACKFFPGPVSRIAGIPDTAPSGAVFLCTENPQLGWGFRKAFSFEPVIKTPFDLLKHLAVWQLQVSNKKSKGGPNGERKELSAH
ncbi:TPA: hypothetical protein ACHYLI_004831, partial [Escherichia coli]